MFTGLQGKLSCLWGKKHSNVCDNITKQHTDYRRTEYLNLSKNWILSLFNKQNLFFFSFLGKRWWMVHRLSKIQAVCVWMPPEWKGEVADRKRPCSVMCCCRRWPSPLLFVSVVYRPVLDFPLDNSQCVCQFADNKIMETYFFT